jgi:hypothetical protein
MDINFKYKKYKENRKTIQFDLLKSDTITSNNIRIAIIIPHRDRLDHLKKFIEYFKKFNFQNNIIDVFIIDQNNADKFNRGMLLNLGYIIAKNKFMYNRYIFHDIDSFPDQDIFNLYFTHLDKNIHYASPDLGYKYDFSNFFGGIMGIKSDDFEKINGFPNTFFGWGGEDDALYNRFIINNINICRPTKGSYKLLDHDGPLKEQTNLKKKENILNDLNVWKNDGINQLLEIFINIKEYDLDNFINTYQIENSNVTNNSVFLHEYLNSKQELQNNNINYYFFKIDYLAEHMNKFDKLHKITFVKNKFKDIENNIKKKYPGVKLYYHKNSNFFSFLEPILSWKEIQSKILDTYTEPKRFQKTRIFKNNSVNKNIQKLVKKNFSYYSKTHTKKDLSDTLQFIFDNFNELIYFRIRDNKIECSYHIYNTNTKKDWYKNLKYLNKDMDSSIINIANDRNIPYYTLRKPHNIVAINCLLAFDSYNYVTGLGLTYVHEFKLMIEYTLNKFKNVPDCDILLNRKDFPFLRKDNKFAYDHLSDSPINNNINFWFIGSQAKTNDNLDVLIPSSDEWNAIKSFKFNNINWNNKKPIAFFRGQSTGCGSDIENNQRLKLADISYKWNSSSDKKNLLDVGLNNLVSRVKAYNFIVNMTNRHKYNYLLKSFVSPEDQLSYKYIFNIEGNSQAYRYSNEFKKNSVIINVKSKFNMWFEPLLKHKKNFIEIESDFSNLYDTLKWLQNNDDSAKNIADAGVRFSNKYINHDSIATYWFFYMFYTNKYSS